MSLAVEDGSEGYRSVQCVWGGDDGDLHSAGVPGGGGGGGSDGGGGGVTRNR